MNVDIIIPTCKSQYAVAPIVNDVEGFSQGCRVLATCAKVSAAANRNIGLKWATADIIIMCDDDMAGFYDGWWQELVSPLTDPAIILVSARLLKRDGSLGPMMYGGDSTGDMTEVPRVPTACIAFRRDDEIRFDENFIGSGFEDDDFCAQLSNKHIGGRVVINNNVKLIHLNEMKNQNGEYYSKNKAYFESKWQRVDGDRVRIPRMKEGTL